MIMAARGAPPRKTVSRAAVDGSGKGKHGATMFQCDKMFYTKINLIDHEAARRASGAQVQQARRPDVRLKKEPPGNATSRRRISSSHNVRSGSFLYARRSAQAHAI
jgi:hypothetical protein